MRIVHVISGLDAAGGGTTAAITGLAAAQCRAGVEVEVIAMYRDTIDAAVADQLKAAGVEVTLIGPATGKLMRHPSLKPLLQKAIARADVVHIAALWEEIQNQAAVIARRQGVPYVISPHGMLDPWSLRQSRWVKRLYMAWRLRKNLKRAAALHYTTETERDLAAPLKIGAPTLVEPNGLDLSEFDSPPPRGQFKARFPALGDRPVILFMSRIHPKKGLDLLIPAFAQVIRSPAGRDVMLALAGPPAPGYQAEVEAMIESHQVRERVVWTGMLRGIERIEALVDADLFTLPSYQENFAIVVAESLAAGTPVVISDQVNIHREVSAAGAGGVVPLNVDALAAELIRWLGDPAARAQASGRAAAFARNHYDWNEIATRWVRHYRSLAKPKPAPSV